MSGPPPRQEKRGSESGPFLRSGRPERLVLADRCASKDGIVNFYSDTAIGQVFYKDTLNGYT